MKKIFVIVFLFLSSCQAIQQGKMFAKCDFRLQSLQSLQVASINIQDINSITQLNMMDAAKLVGAFAQKELPLTLTANLEIKNPNLMTAALNRMDWIMLVDGKEVLTGTSNQRVEVAPEGTALMPLSVSMDLKKVFEGKGQDEIFGFGWDLSKEKEKSTRFKFKVKPYFSFAGAMIAYPGYIDITDKFVSAVK